MRILKEIHGGGNKKGYKCLQTLYKLAAANAYKRGKFPENFVPLNVNKPISLIEIILSAMNAALFSAQAD